MSTILNCSDIHEFARDSFMDFKSLYKDRPIKTNKGGMEVAHSFALYCFLKILQPKVVVESGVWKGHSTWLIEETLPEAELLCFDIDFSRLVYRSDSAHYIQGDISSTNWTELFDCFKTKNISEDNILLFLDDHQHFDERIDFIRDSGLRHIIVEDNYPCDQGDALSPKKIIESEDSCIIVSNGTRNRVEIDHELKNKFHSMFPQIEIFPPLYHHCYTRWNTPFSSYKTPQPVFKDPLAGDEELYSHSLDYNWMAYLKTAGKPLTTQGSFT